MSFTVNMLWMGGPLGPIERLSIISFLAAGHRVRLHVYDEAGGVPEGTEVTDAAEIVPRALLMPLKYKGSKSFALASDYFRLKLMQRNEGLWADCDVVCLAPIERREPSVFGWENAASVNNAVLYLAPDSPVVTDILGVFDRKEIPSWMPPQRQREMRIRRLLHLRYQPQWGTFGPKALTEFAGRHDLLRLAEPQKVFYPVPWADAPKMFDPGASLEPFLAAETRAVHLWNSALGDFRQSRPPKQSPLGKLLTRFGV